MDIAVQQKSETIQKKYMTLHLQFKDLIESKDPFVQTDPKYKRELEQQ